ncbi:helix-turn-helix domain-containing protein [Phytopseudomonas daroniae]|uniref:helix-turn-helix domain-containing protein n=1 Tax=Phytopseudomonas daroniae TaxID=2487519 RepID=UPI0010385A85|nr:helix-turn-helix domain-containing protein [Pseudomonas daroniae]TBU71486.1 DNA-binding protein [Pseudomonas daroniae]
MLSKSSTNAHSPDLWTPAQAAQELGVSTRTLSAWRSSGRHALPYVKIGRLVRYRASDIADWLQANVHCGKGVA